MRTILELAYERGLIGSTFATHDEHSTPGYSEAYAHGAAARAAVHTEPCLCTGPCPLPNGAHLGVHTHCRLA